MITVDDYSDAHYLRFYHTHTYVESKHGITVRYYLPGEPQLEGISPSATLDSLVPQVVFPIQLVWLKEICRVGCITLLQQTCTLSMPK